MSELIIFEENIYPVRKVAIEGYESAFMISTEDLESALINDGAYTSPEARLIDEQISVIDERLIEMDYGPYEGTDLTHLSPESQGRYWSKYIGNCAIYIATNADGRIGVPYELPK